jgi:signal transduction histidine kinase
MVDRILPTPESVRVQRHAGVQPDVGGEMRAQRLLAAAAALNEAVSVEDVADVILGAGLAATGGDAASLAVVREGADGAAELETVRIAGYTADVVARYQRYPVTRGRPVSDAVLERTPVLIASSDEWMARYPEVARQIASYGYTAFAAVPVLAHGRVLAGLSFSFREPQAFDEATRTFLATLGEQCALEGERARLFEAADRARREAEEARARAEEAYLRADRANRAKMEFLRTMSHELRTPLNAIGGYAELLELGVHGPITAAQADALERLQKSQRHLLGLINQLLAYARVESQAVTYEPADIPIDEALRGVEALVAPQLRAKGLTYRYDGCDPEVRVRADGEKLRQVVINLLSNAIKFTDDRDGTPGCVALACEALPDADVVFVRVRDTGVGIAAEKLAAIFEPFVQLDPSHTRTTQGVGLGLTISRELARGMGGELTVESTPGVGSIFTLTLPRAAGAPATDG